MTLQRDGSQVIVKNCSIKEVPRSFIKVAFQRSRERMEKYWFLK
jgi:hypothetical protein